MQNYRDLVACGQGQFGIAYKAQSKQDGQLYCIKRIPMKGVGDEQASTLKEAQLLSSLEHPNIIGYKESFIDSDESLCIVTSFCEEGDLFKLIRDKEKQKENFDEEEIMDMFIQISSALMYIHTKKVLHRDLKTQNIFIARGSIMKLGDFGIAKVLEKTDQFATTVTGTPYYMAPEICSSQPYTFKSDIWSLGCVLYELCTLKHAFAADSLLSLVYQIVRGNFPPIPKERYSPGLSNLVNNLLVRDPNARPNLQQVFQMPYVQDHVHRYHKQEKKRAERALAKAASKKLTSQEHAFDPRSHGKDMETMTPADKMKKRRESEADKRKLELQVAAMNMNKDRMQVAGRKTRMVHESNIGLPGGGGTRGRPSDPYDNTLPSSSQYQGMGTGGMMNMDTMPGGGNMDSYVNMDTMPSGSNFSDPNMHSGDWQRNAAPGASYSQHDSRRVGGGNTMQAGGRGFNGGDSNGMGHDTMVNMGTMNLGTMNLGGNSTVNYGTLPAMRAPMPMVSQSQPHTPADPGRGDVRFSSVQPTPSKDDDYESDYSEYESDFEDYDGNEGDQMVTQRMKIVSNVAELGRAGGPVYKQMDTVQDKIGSTIKNSKAQALREKCQASLSSNFDGVYTYLRRARTAAHPPEEREVQRRLMELVGNKRELMPGCFMVDQLVFQESMVS